MADYACPHGVPGEALRGTRRKWVKSCPIFLLFTTFYHFLPGISTRGPREGLLEGLWEGLREGLCEGLWGCLGYLHKRVSGGIHRGCRGSYECPLYMSDTPLLLSIGLGDSVYEEEGVI